MLFLLWWKYISYYEVYMTLFENITILAFRIVIAWAAVPVVSCDTQSRPINI